ncbi:Hypothetical protein FKW44_005328, partial [Caligus rogercresseyi]
TLIRSVSDTVRLQLLYLRASPKEADAIGVGRSRRLPSASFIVVPVPLIKA